MSMIDIGVPSRVTQHGADLIIDLIMANDDHESYDVIMLNARQLGPDSSDPL